MPPKNFFSSPSCLLALLVSPALAQLPYNPTRIISNSNGTFAYIFAPESSSSQFSLSILDTSDVLDSTNASTALYSDLPFLSKTASKAFIPLPNDAGDITVLAGTCQKGAQGLELWRFVPTADKKFGTWTNLQMTLVDSTLSANYLSAGFSFSPTSSTNDGVYVFGGMCPQTEATTVSDWTLDATYSNTMLTLSPDTSSSSASAPYDISLTGQRAPPIAEAGLSITPLMPTYTNTSAGNISQQQNFVLIGGHTQNAFINMSQVALFSLPEQSWAFLGIDQPAGTDGSTELLTRGSTSVEPRSGHTAVMTPDGSRIVVFGGWVGNVDTPASPQLAMLEIGQGYGGTGDWAWTIPSQVSDPFASGEGVYGHGATMLPGGVMLIKGGYHITAPGSKKKRQTNNQLLFFNTTSSSWISSYTNPSSPNSPVYVAPDASSSGSLSHSSQKAGLGAGLGLGFAAVIGIIVFWLVYRRRLRQQRAVRERELRELALGSDQYHSASIVQPGVDGRGGYPELRTASWSNRQEQRVENPGDVYPWAPVISPDQAERMRLEQEDHEGNGMRRAERTGLLMDVPSPTRGLRRSLHSRGPSSYGANFSPHPGGAPSVFRIDEEEEGSQTGSLRRAKTPAREGASRASDPFKDPPSIAPTSEPQQDFAAEERKKEVQGWVEDWSAAAESMNISRNPSKATTHGRTYSNLSQSQGYPQSNSNSHSGGSQSGRGSPEKSDRTGSNLSERSMMSSYSIQRSQTGTVSRNMSMRSASTGYALFAGAAAAMAAKVRGEPSKLAQAEYGTVNTGRGHISRAPSKRSTSLNLNSTGSNHGQPTRDRSDTFSTARTSIGPILPGEDHALLSRMNSRAVADEKDYWATPPESPIKNRYARADSFGSQAGRKALGILGSMKRVFTGTGTVDVQDRVAALEGRSGQSSPTKDSNQPDMIEVGPRRTVSAGAAPAFWRGKRGAKDWDEGDEPGVGPSSTVRRKPVPGQAVITDNVSEDGDWDVETAVQNRVVQVMFTVPKEKLRVVNVDALSLLSKSDVDFEGGENDEDAEKVVKRMSSVREGDEVEEVAERPSEEKPPQEEKGKERDKEEQPNMVPKRASWNPKYVFND